MEAPEDTLKRQQAPLVVRWLRAQLPLRAHGRSPQLRKVQLSTGEPVLQSPGSTTREPSRLAEPRAARRLQRLEPEHLEPALHQRSRRSEKPGEPQLEKAHARQ